jgi:hypothetical protein
LRGYSIVNSIRKIKNSDYFAISVNGQDDWIMRPALGRRSAWPAGMSPNGTAWFFNAEAGFAFYDAASHQLVDRLRTPLARGFDEKETPGAGHSALLEGEDGRLAYLLLYHGGRSTDLHVIDVERREIIRSVLELPGAYWLCKPVLNQNGRILVPAILHDDATGAGLLRIDPQTGNCEISACSGPRSRAWLVHSSPCGRYWLRADDSRIPMVEEEASLLSRLFSMGATPPKEYFSFAIEIWEAFPLRRLHSVAPMWMTPEQLPDNGQFDGDRWKTGLPAQRGQIYRKISQLLDQDATLAASQIDRDSHPDLWPDPNSFYSNINSNLGDFAFSERDIVGWQPDHQAFWLTRYGFVSCVGVDGTVSPRIMLERFGMQPGTWRPCARAWYEATPLPDRRLDLRFEEGIVTVAGTLGNPVHRARIVPTSDDHFRPYQPSQEDDKDAALAKKAEAIAKRYSVYAIDLASMNEADCVSAIDALASRIGPDINERPFDNRLQAVFRLDGKRINEKKFFTHVAKHCPSAASAVRRLVDAVCEHMSPHTVAYYDPYADEIPTALFGYAAWCLARLDQSSNDVLVRYRNLVDTYHENFYFENTVPLMLENAKDASDRLALAERFYFADLGNAVDYSTFWRMAKMAEDAAISMTPRQYAARLVALAAKTSMTRSPSDLGYYCFDNLARDLKDPSLWEKELWQEIRNAVTDPAPQ